ncbi:Mur ligase domain-containing protein, partial [Actinomadura sp. HBU206391]|uniref:Mur ligase domain-containing protein n=1 Tax=Actinomadura sp. HBU206391 TaxID=2731692 RepID=UPI001D61296C
MRPTTRPARPLAGLARLLDPENAGGGADAYAQVTVTGITHDSRQVLPGDLYAALPGSSVHGAEFASQAAAAG